VTKNEHEGGFKIRVPPPFVDDRSDALVLAGVEDGLLEIADSDPTNVASRLTELVTIAALEATKLKVTHGSIRDEVMRTRRLEGVVAKINEVLGGDAAPGAWSSDLKIPVQFRNGTVQLTLWPKDAGSDIVLAPIVHEMTGSGVAVLSGER
jgi:hypothetical protein